MQTTYGESALRQAAKFVRADDGWRLTETRQEGPADQPPLNAFAVVTSAALRLRFVVDRGISHLDVGCRDESGTERWVPVEIVELAAGLSSADQFRQSQRDWCEELDPRSGTIPEVDLDHALAQLGRRTDDIIRAANNPKAIAEAETLAASITTEILDALDVYPHLDDANTNPSQ